MITLNQVMLLEQKVESAVEKIQQLTAENDALRKKCSELSNALSSKTEQLSSYEQDQSQIEQGIKKALDRLTSIENSVLKAAAQANIVQNQAVRIEQTAAVEKAVAQSAAQEPVVAASPAVQEMPLSNPAAQQTSSAPQETQAPVQAVPVSSVSTAFTQGSHSAVTNPSAQVSDNFAPPADLISQSFDSLQNVPSDSEPDFGDDAISEDEPQDDLGFDIF